MMRLCLSSFLGLAVAVAVAWQLGGRVGAGVLSGYLLGAGMSGLGVLYQRHMLLTRPERVFSALVVSFLGKLVALLLGGLAFRFLQPVAEIADWRSFLIAFAAAVALVLPVGTWEAARVLKHRARSAGREVGA
jgi:hypothetical protein